MLSSISHQRDPPDSWSHYLSMILPYRTVYECVSVKTPLKLDFDSSRNAKKQDFVRLRKACSSLQHPYNILTRFYSSFSLFYHWRQRWLSSGVLLEDRNRVVNLSKKHAPLCKRMESSGWWRIFGTSALSVKVLEQGAFNETCVSFELLRSCLFLCVDLVRFWFAGEPQSWSHEVWWVTETLSK